MTFVVQFKELGPFYADFGLFFQENLKSHISLKFSFRYNVTLLTLQFRDEERRRQI